MQTQTFGNFDCSLQDILWEWHKAEKCRLTSIIESAYGSEQELSDLILFPFGCFQK